MKTILILSFIALVCVSSSVAKELLVGTSYNARLTWQQKVEYMAIPLTKRVKEVFYADHAQQIIRSVIARESSPTEATATITAGGVGYPFVNIRFKSERGSGLDYSVEIYV